MRRAERYVVAGALWATAAYAWLSSRASGTGRERRRVVTSSLCAAIGYSSQLPVVLETATPDATWVRAIRALGEGAFLESSRQHWLWVVEYFAGDDARRAFVDRAEVGWAVALATGALSWRVPTGEGGTCQMEHRIARYGGAWNVALHAVLLAGYLGNNSYRLWRVYGDPEWVGEDRRLAWVARMHRLGWGTGVVTAAHTAAHAALRKAGVPYPLGNPQRVTDGLLAVWAVGVGGAAVLVAVANWMERYRAYRALFPLWSDVCAAVGASIPGADEHYPRCPRWDAVCAAGLDERLAVRKQEMHDGMLVIRAYARDTAGIRARAERAGLEGEALAAAVEAAIMLDGLGRRRAGAPPETWEPAGPAYIPPEEEELGFLVRVADTYAALRRGGRAIREGWPVAPVGAMGEGA